MARTSKKSIVGRTQALLSLLIILLIAAGWLATAYGTFVDRELIEQNQALAPVDKFLEDHLYVRAANACKTAMTDYHTKNNQAIEDRLVSIYEAGEMMPEYYDLVKTRIGKNVASEQEIINLASYTMESGSESNAMSVLLEGLKKYPDSEELKSLLATVQFDYMRTAADVAELNVVGTSGNYPASNGSAWGVLNKSGRMALDFQYEELLPFSGKYAIAKIDGVYTLIDGSGYWNAVDKNGLDQVTQHIDKRIVGVKDGKAGIYSNTFQPITEEQYEDVILNDNRMVFVKKEGKWALLDENLKPVTEYIFTDVPRNQAGSAIYKSFAVVADANGYYIINTKGEPCMENRFAEMRALESGYAACEEGNKWGFCNEKGNLMIAAEFEDAKSFSGELAAIQYAGKWGYINKDDIIVIENEYAEASSFIGDTAIVKDDMGQYRFLTLKYYEMYTSNK